MSGATTFIVTIAVAGGVLLVSFVVYYLGTIATSLYETKVGLKKELDQKIDEMNKTMEKEFQQRTLWMRSEAQEEAKKVRIEIGALLDEQRVATNRALDALQQQTNAVQAVVVALEAARAAEAEKAKPLLARAAPKPASAPTPSAAPKPAETASEAPKA